ncbi:hypothetical protein CVT25_013893 [Psilocybe cyanescens]|uniref:Uncharacterized protein n=1 Tax=Psilocybe cyanescens TaxID=93625 RepID=A0A409XZ89_PSICY|nr:hypothetical protein CVT25_013893 [Psilocybe cyanescens]
MSPHPRRACSRNAIFWTTALNIVFLTAGVLFFLEGVRLQRNVESEFISRVTSFCEFYCIFCNNNRTNKSIILAPASGVISYYPRLFNLSSEEAMHYQGHPTPEITAAWDRITDDGIRSILYLRISCSVRPMRIPVEMLPLVNTKDDETLIKFAEEDGGGVMASVGVLHQLHCVNLLRKATYGEYYKDDRFFTVPAEELRGHLDHCVELLRQTISCAGDVTVLTYRWHGDKPHPNFDKIHQCRRFDDILDWALEHAVHIPASHMVRNITAGGSH